MGDVLNLSHLREWIGGEELAEDQLSASLVERFRAALDLPGEAARVGDVAPRLIHFCLCQPSVPTTALGTDGHPISAACALAPADVGRQRAALHRRFARG